MKRFRRGSTCACDGLTCGVFTFKLYQVYITRTFDRKTRNLCVAGGYNTKIKHVKRQSYECNAPTCWRKIQMRGAHTSVRRRQRRRRQKSGGRRNKDDGSAQYIRYTTKSHISDVATYDAYLLLCDCNMQLADLAGAIHFSKRENRDDGLSL